MDYYNDRDSRIYNWIAEQYDFSQDTHFDEPPPSRADSPVLGFCHPSSCAPRTVTDDTQSNPEVSQRHDRVMAIIDVLNHALIPSEYPAFPEEKQPPLSTPSSSPVYARDSSLSHLTSPLLSISSTLSQYAAQVGDRKAMYVPPSTAAEIIRVTVPSIRTIASSSTISQLEADTPELTPASSSTSSQVDIQTLHGTSSPTADASNLAPNSLVGRMRPAELHIPTSHIQTTSDHSPVEAVDAQDQPHDGDTHLTLSPAASASRWSLSTSASRSPVQFSPEKKLAPMRARAHTHPHIPHNDALASSDTSGEQSDQLSPLELRSPSTITSFTQKRGRFMSFVSRLTPSPSLSSHYQPQSHRSSSPPASEGNAFLLPGGKRVVKKQSSLSSLALGMGAISMGMASKARDKKEEPSKLILTGLTTSDESACDAVRLWAESFGEVRVMSRNHEGVLCVEFTKPDLVDKIVRQHKQVYIEGVGHANAAAWRIQSRRSTKTF